MNGKIYIYVQNRDGHPLMPTTRRGHVGYLLRTGRAKVVAREPFTIRLLYETPDIVQPLYVGIDPGRTNIGIAVVDDGGDCKMEVKVKTRNKDIPKLMSSRKAARQRRRKCGRRDVRRRRAVKADPSRKEAVISRMLPQYKKPVLCHNIKNKEAKFNHRVREPGWLTPTANHLLQTHLNVVEKTAKLVPVAGTCVEINKFAFMALDNPNVKPWEYQRGPLYQKGNLHDAVYEMQSGRCLLCNKGGIDHYHHIVARAAGGSDTIDNIAGICDKCHNKMHKDEKAVERLKKKKAGMNKKYGALSVLNQIIPRLIDELGSRFSGETYVIEPKSTAEARRAGSIEKDHDMDAYCIACVAVNAVPSNDNISDNRYQMVQYRRHDRRALHQENNKRRYADPNGNVVATNRHKATMFLDNGKEVKEAPDSVEEYRAKHSSAEISVLRVLDHKPTYRHTDRVMPGALVRYERTDKKSKKVTNEMFVLDSSDGFHYGRPDSYVSTNGKKYGYAKCSVIKHNAGFVFTQSGM